MGRRRRWRLRRLRRRRRLQRRRRREGGSDARDGGSGGDAVPRRRPTRAGRRGTARSSTARPPGATTSPGRPTSTSCWCSTIRRADHACAPWRRRSRPGGRPRREPPLLIEPAEWARASDVFPDRDHRHAGRLPGAPGRRPAGTALVEPADLRQALEREFRGKLLRLRQGYAAAAGDPSSAGRAGEPAAPATILVLLRALLRSARPSRCRGDPLELAAAAAAPVGADGEPWLDVGRASGRARLALHAVGVRALHGRRGAGGGVRGPTSARRSAMKRSSGASASRSSCLALADRRVRLQHDPDDGRDG